MADTWSPPASDAPVQAAWQPPASDQAVPPGPKVTPPGDFMHESAYQSWLDQHKNERGGVEFPGTGFETLPDPDQSGAPAGKGIARDHSITVDPASGNGVTHDLRGLWNQYAQPDPVSGQLELEPTPEQLDQFALPGQRGFTADSKFAQGVKPDQLGSWNDDHTEYHPPGWEPPSATSQAMDKVGKLAAGAYKGANAAADQLVNDPMSAVRGAGDLGYAAVQGLAEPYHKAAASVDVLAGAAPVLYDKAKSLLSGKETTAAGDWWFGNSVQPLTDQDDAFQVAKDAGLPTKLANSFGSALGFISQAVLTGGENAAAPALASGTDVAKAAVEHGVKAAAVPALSDAVDTGRQVYAQTGDGAAALKAAQMQWLVTSSSAVLPMGMQGTIPVRAASGAGVGVLQGEAGREAMNTALPNDMQTPFTAEGVALNAAGGAVLAGFGGKNPAARPDAAFAKDEGGAEGAGKFDVNDLKPRPYSREDTSFLYTEATRAAYAQDRAAFDAAGDLADKDAQRAEAYAQANPGDTQAQQDAKDARQAADALRSDALYQRYAPKDRATNGPSGETKPPPGETESPSGETKPPPGATPGAEGVPKPPADHPIMAIGFDRQADEVAAQATDSGEITTKQTPTGADVEVQGDPVAKFDSPEEAEQVATNAQKQVDERRLDLEGRKRVDDMTPEEMRQELLTHPLTGIPNRRAWDEMDKGPNQAMIDADGLKYINDAGGHAAGDAHLRSIAAALQAAMPGKVAHFGGDEFAAHADTPEELDAGIARAKGILSKAKTEITHKDGSVETFTGIGFSHGTGTTLEEADRNLIGAKEERERQGLRPARGQPPIGSVKVAPEARLQGDEGNNADAGRDREGVLGPTATVLGQVIPKPANPTEAQKKSGNYAKPVVQYHGLPIRVENVSGGYRSGVDANGKAWKTRMKEADYGYFEGTRANDGDGVDVFMGKKPDNGNAYVIDQLDPETKKFDEHKVVVGVDSPEEAKALYLRHYEKGWKGFGGVTELPVEHLKQWLQHDDHTQPIDPDSVPAEKVQRGPGPNAQHDSLLEYLARHSKGIDSEEAEAQGIDPADMKIAAAHVGIRRAFRKGGMTFDQAAEHLHEAGYPVMDEFGRYDPNVLLDKIDDELRGKKVYSSHNESRIPQRDEIPAWRRAKSEAEYDAMSADELRAHLANLERMAEEEDIPFSRPDDFKLTAPGGKAGTQPERQRTSTMAQGDLFGDKVALRNEIEKAKAALERKLSTGQASPETGKPGDLFSQSRQQTEIPGAETRKSQQQIQAERRSAEAQERNSLLPGTDDEKIAHLEEELKTVKAEQNRQYWAFTRTARGKPVDPAITRRAEEITDQLGELRARTTDEDVEKAKQGARERLAAESKEGWSDGAKALDKEFIGRDDDFWGVTFDENDVSKFKDTEFGGTQCTGFACAILHKLGPERARVMGFSSEDNPGSKIAADAGGHDFALVDGRYIVDPWLSEGFSTAMGDDKQPLPTRGVYDLENPNDKRIIQYLYGDQAKWKDMTSKMPKKSAPADTIAARLEQVEKQLGIKPAGALEDAGEKIGGARKDLWKERGLRLSDLENMTEAEGAEAATKHAVWKPDWQKLVDGGMAKDTAALAKIMWDKLGARPRHDTPIGRRNYVEALTKLADIIRETKNTTELRNTQTKFMQALGGGDGYSIARTPEQAAARDKFWSIHKGRRSVLNPGYKEIDAAKKLLLAGFPGDIEPWRRSYNLRQSGDGEWVLNTKNESPYQSWRFKTKEEAEALGRNRFAEAKTKAAGMETEERMPERPHLDTIERAGPPVREGDVTSQQFIDDFGFRGIEFGNWAANDERQKLLNHAYDALQDLARIMGVPPKALSLNGTMGLALGARGKGRALAHYEPSKLVINMTKINGAGSLAHEWAHAFDHYMGEYGRPDAYQGRARGASGWYDDPTYRTVAHLRPEMQKAWDDVQKAMFQRQKTRAELLRDMELSIENRQAALDQQRARLERAQTKGTDDKTFIRRLTDWIKGEESSLQDQRARLEQRRSVPEEAGNYGLTETQYKKNSQTLSGGSKTGYWRRPTEMFARAFESFIEDKIAAEGNKSQYLVHGTDAEMNERMAWKANPYPNEDRPAINAAIQHLVDTLETRTEGDKEVMFSRPDTDNISEDNSTRYEISEPSRNKAGSQRDLRSASGVPQLELFANADQPGPAAKAARLARSVRLQKVGTFRSGHAVIDNWKQAAHVVAQLRKSPQEVMAALVLDANRKPIAVIHHTVGMSGESQVEAWSLAGAVAHVPGAASVYFAHNHPTGFVNQSVSDNLVTNRLAILLRGTGIEPMGMIVVAPGSTQASFHYANQSSDGLPLPITPAGKTKVQVPVMGRRWAKTPGHVKTITKIAEPDAFKKTAQAAKDSGYKSGVLLLDNHNNVVATVPMEPKDMRLLRTGNSGNGAAELLRTISELNTNGAIAFGPQAAAQNVGTFMNAASVRLVDVVHSDENGNFVSANKHGVFPRTFNYFARPAGGDSAEGGATGGTGPVTADGVRAAVSKFLENFATKPEVTVFDKPQDALDDPELGPSLKARGADSSNWIAFVRNQKIYIAASAVHHLDAVPGIVAHEMIVHYGLRSLFGNKSAAGYRAILEGVKMAMPGEVERRGRIEYGSAYDGGNRDHTDRGAEETLAYYSQKYQAGQDVPSRMRRLLDRLYAMIRDFGRRVMGLAPKFDETWMRRVLTDLEAHLRRGKGEEAPESEPAYASRQPTFYSAVERAVESAKRDKGTGAEWEATLRNMPGVKGEEMDWIGLKDWLEGRGRVTRQEVLDYVRANKIELGEVVNRAHEPELDEAERDEILKRLADAGYELESNQMDGTPEIYMDGERVYEDELPGDLRSDYHQLLRDQGDEDGPRYQSYTLPGGKDYTERLLTLEKAGPPRGIDAAARREIYEKYQPELQAIDDELGQHFAGTIPHVPGRVRALEARKTMLQAQRDAEADERGGSETRDPFTSGHWPEENVLVHIRHDERTTAEGERALHIAEIQSDWHQAGRKKGYSSNLGPSRRAVYQAKENAHRALRANEFLGFDSVPEAMAAVMLHDDWQDRWGDMPESDIAAVNNYRRLKIAARSAKDVVPDAPFKTTWHELALKRMLREAVEKGYGALSWDTGLTNAERYNMSRVADAISIAHDGTQQGQDLFRLHAYKGDKTVIQATKMTPKNLAEYVGKDMAEKAIADHVAGKVISTFKGDDLRVGGAGMTGFYDKILPAAMNKYVKKWGGKVESGHVEGLPGGARQMDDVLDRAENPTHGMIPAHVVRITPAMRESVMEGQPMFSRPEQGEMDVDNRVRGSKPYELVRSAVTSMVDNRLVMDIRKLVNPPGISDVAERTAQHTIAFLGDLAHQKEAALKNLEQFARQVDKLSPQDKLDSIHAIETGTPQPIPELQPMANAVRKILDTWRKHVQDLGEGHLEHFIENYFPHWWGDPVAAAKVFASIQGRRTMRGPATFLKKRTIPTVREGIEMGLRPITINPLIATLMKVHEMQRFVSGVTMMRAYKELGLARFYPATQHIPEGWVKIDDPIARVSQWSDAEQGFINRGSYAMPEDAARIINNHLSASRLRNFAPAQYIRVGANMLNALQLSFSAFHAGFTTFDAIVSKNALGIERLLHGEPIRAAQAFLEAGTGPGAAVMNVRRGMALYKAYLNPSGATPEMRQLVNALIQGGGRVTMDRYFSAAEGASPFQRVGAMTLAGDIHAALKGENPMSDTAKAIGAFPIEALTSITQEMRAMTHTYPALQIPFEVASRVTRASTALIMEKLVPMQKLGVFSDLASDWLRRNPTAGPVEMQAAMQSIWRSVDNRLGEIVYDNEFWDRTFKDALHLAVRSVGWNSGSIKEIAGAPVDVVKVLDKVIREKKLEGSDWGHKIPYLLGLLITQAAIGALLNRWLSGEWPKDMKDYMFPRTGRKHKDGSAERLSLPSYMKDIYEYFQKPGETIANKANPWIGIVYHEIAGTDYFGNSFLNPNATEMERWRERLAYAGTELKPFSLQGAQNMEGAKDPGLEGEAWKWAPFFGGTPAPGYITKPELIAAYQHRENEESYLKNLRMQLSKARKDGDREKARELQQQIADTKRSEAATKRQINQEKRHPTSQLMDKVGPIIDGSSSRSEMADGIEKAGYPALAGLIRSLPDTLRPQVMAQIQRYA